MLPRRLISIWKIAMVFLTLSSACGIISLWPQTHLRHQIKYYYTTLKYFSSANKDALAGQMYNTDCSVCCYVNVNTSYTRDHYVI